MRWFSMVHFKQTSFYFIRHGQTDWNAEKRMQGHKDIPLNVTGAEQASYAANTVLQGLSITRICHSPLLRAKQTAEIIGASLNIPLLEIENLKEVGFGIMEGKRKTENPNIFLDWLKGRGPEGAETPLELKNRVKVAVQQSLDDAEDNNTLVVSHGVCFHVLQDIIGCRDPIIKLDSCQVVHIKKQGGSSWIIKKLA